jgi:hypothetical protein
MSVAHLGFHKHSAYILERRQRPFPRGRQGRLALLIYGCRGGWIRSASARAP